MTGALASRSPPEGRVPREAQRWTGLLGGGRLPADGSASWVGDWAVAPRAGPAVHVRLSAMALCGRSPVSLRSPVSHVCSVRQGSRLRAVRSLYLVTASCQLFSFNLLANAGKLCSLSSSACDSFQIPFKILTTGMKCGLERGMPAPVAKLLTFCWLTAGPVYCSCPGPSRFGVWFSVVPIPVSSLGCGWLQDINCIFFSCLSFKPSTVTDRKRVFDSCVI